MLVIGRNNKGAVVGAASVRRNYLKTLNKVRDILGVMV